MYFELRIILFNNTLTKEHALQLLSISKELYSTYLTITIAKNR